MSDYEPMSAPPPDRPALQPRGEAPPSIRTSVNLVWAIVAVSVVSALLSLLLMDDMVTAALESQAEGLTEDVARAGVIGGAVVGLLFAGIWALLGVFVRRGANWARIVLTVLGGIGIVFGLVGLAGGAQPGLLVVTGIISLVLDAALLWFLWQKDASAYLKARPAY